MGCFTCVFEGTDNDLEERRRGHRKGGRRIYGEIMHN
jgi:hypothetical protein